MDELDEAFLRVDAVIKRLETSAQSAGSRSAAAPAAAEWDSVTRRIDAALAKARAAHAALD